MMKYLMVLLSLFSGSVLGMGRVNELCGIDSVKTIEIINLPSYVTTLVPLSAYSALFDHGLASKSDQRFASIRSTGNLTFSTAF